MASPSASNGTDNQTVNPGNPTPPSADSNVSGVQASKSLLEENGFRIIKGIGSGSYSKVKLAYSNDHKTNVAIKIISKYHVPEEFLRKFLHNEIKVVKFLRHENIIKYFQSIESSHRLYVVMQHAENGSILSLIHKERRLSEQRACNFFRQIVAGIEYIHAQGVAHRDIKCENILLDENFTVKIIDFGFSRSFREAQALTTSNQLNSALNHSSAASAKTGGGPRVSETYCGSYAYASPEILRGIPYDPFLSDVWAMGCVLYAMVFGRLPFDDRDPAKLLKQVQSPVVFPSNLEASEPLKDLLRHIFAPVKQRYTIDDINKDPWFNTAYLNENQPRTSFERRTSTR